MLELLLSRWKGREHSLTKHWPIGQCCNSNKMFRCKEGHSVGVFRFGCIWVDLGGYMNNNREGVAGGWPVTTCLCITIAELCNVDISPCIGEKMFVKRSSVQKFSELSRLVT